MDHPSGSIEHIIQRVMGELGFAEPVFRRHAFLLRDRQLVGRRFCFEGVEVLWLSAERQLKLYDERGEFLRVVNVGDEQRRKAA
jgi:hypothetical protein